MYVGGLMEILFWKLLYLFCDIGNKVVNEEGKSDFRNLRWEGLKELSRKAVWG